MKSIFNLSSKACLLFLNSTSMRYEDSSLNTLWGNIRFLEVSSIKVFMIGLSTFQVNFKSYKSD